MIHRLKIEYNKFINQRYDLSLWGDRNPNKTEIIAQKVQKLGIDYRLFVKVAVLMWEDMAKDKAYPYWNMITSDLTFQMIEELLELTEGLDLEDDEYFLFTAELQYALNYIDWYNGNTDKKPWEGESDIDIQIQVAEYICKLEGIPCISSDYDFVAEQLKEK